MQIVKQQGILDPATSPRDDADVIMSAAIVGHAYVRLAAAKTAMFDMEIDPATMSLPPGQVAPAAAADWNLHLRGIAKINAALAVMGGDFGRQAKGKEVIAGVTPIYGKDGGVVRIIGGSGNLPAGSSERYVAAAPPEHTPGALLMKIAQMPDVGYQGRGAYTGFVQLDDPSRQPGLFSTFRHRVAGADMPLDKANPRRWLPSAVKSPAPGLKDATAASKPAWDLGAEIGPGDDQRYWGMIVDNAKQSCGCRPDTLKAQGMYFQDEDMVRYPRQRKLGPGDIVGYTHGMIQAIYDVAWRKAGKPYEIAVGNQTTKLASCFTCAIFMEANGFPASSTHLGRGESWCPLYAEASDPASTQDAARRDCNAKWAAYCKLVIDAGIKCIATRLSDASHAASFQKLSSYLAAHKDPFDYANLILDAVTVHDSEIKRIDRTLKA